MSNTDELDAKAAEKRRLADAKVAEWRRNLQSRDGILAEMRKLYELGRYDKAWIDQRIKELEEDKTFNPPTDGSYDPEYLDDEVEHKTEIILCEVARNDLGETLYAIYFADKANPHLAEPLAVTIHVEADGRVRLSHTQNRIAVEDILLMLKLKEGDNQQEIK